MFVRQNKIKADKTYWICDFWIASKDNVFKHCFGFNGRILHEAGYVAYTAKKEALAVSLLLENDERLFLSMGANIDILNKNS